jgi:lipoprotein-releasing system permease protein
LYKLLLCWRYLLTRYLALACIISVMLGVATLIVVNSVMSGFSTKLKERLHGLLSDIVIEGMGMEGFPNATAQMQRIRESPVGHKIEAMTPTVEIFAILHTKVYGRTMTRPVHLVGVDPATRCQVGGFAEHLVRQKNAALPSFEPPPEARWRYSLNQAAHHPQPAEQPQLFDPQAPPPPDPPPSVPSTMPQGLFLGKAIGSYRKHKEAPGEGVEDIYFLDPGDEVVLTTLSVGKPIPISARYVITDYFKSDMSEYDSNYVFVSLADLQRLRAMDDRVTSIQIKLKDYGDAKEVVEELKKMFPGNEFMVQTWEEKQGPLLAAIRIEKGILNILLFLIIGVAGFGILAIFSMIVVEKTRDIGILKALGASNRGVMSIFLGYGLLLGVVGALCGTGLGVGITMKINNIDHFLAKTFGQNIFNPEVYYFKEIPTDIQPMTVLLVNLGAIAIAVVFSVLPALRAALLHPVRALRYE